MQLRYDARADRLLWQIRSRQGELFAVWLTRRLALRLWPHFERMVTQASMPQVNAASATLVPQARELMAEIARQRPLPAADFQAPFDAAALARPLGPEPLLPDTLDLTPTPKAPGQGLSIHIKEAGGRSLRLQLGHDLATALMRMLEQALQSSDWLPPPSPATSLGAGSSETDKAPLAS